MRLYSTALFKLLGNLVITDIGTEPLKTIQTPFVPGGRSRLRRLIHFLAFARLIDRPIETRQNKKADATKHLEEFHRVGSLSNQPLGVSRVAFYLVFRWEWNAVSNRLAPPLTYYLFYT